jgi:hypothetical protein
MNNVSIPQSLLTGAFYVGAEKLFVKAPFLNREGGMKFLESTASAYLSSRLGKAVLPDTVRSQDSSMFVDPAVSGVLFASLDHFLKSSDQSFLYKVLVQAGSQLGAYYVEDPLMKLMNPPQSSS